MADRGRRRYLWLLIGTLLSLFAVGGWWDVPLAAWLFSIFLVRFCRDTRPLVGIPLVFLSTCAAAGFWLAETELPIRGLPLFAVAGGAALSAVLVLPYLADRLVAVRLRGRHPLLATVVFPATRVACELLIATVSPFGAIYGMLSATQLDDLPLLQIASVTGAYGVSFLVAWLAPVAVEVWQRRPDWRGVLRGFAVYGLVLGAVLAGGAWCMRLGSPAPTVRIAVISAARTVQDDSAAAVGGSLYDLHRVGATDPSVVRSALAPLTGDLLAATEREADAGARVVVWPETQARVLAQDENALLAQLGAVAKQKSIYLAFGLGVYTQAAPYGRNEAVLIGPDGKVLTTYQKRHPVPGLEHYQAGTDPVQDVQTPYGKLALLVCYDADFPATARKDADIMLVPSDDWAAFGVVHTPMERLRAIENGYTLIRPDINGFSAAYDGNGRTLGGSSYYQAERAAIVVNAPIAAIRSAYTTIGDTFAWLCVAALAGLLAVAVSTRGEDRWEQPNGSGRNGLRS